MPVYGSAGGSLGEAAWLGDQGRANVGAYGEKRTAEVLDAIAARDGVTVLHDLRIPGAAANIDHVVVSGRKVTVIDSKKWKPGLYWTFRGKTRRGVELFEPADRKTIPFAVQRLRERFAREQVSAVFQRPLLVVWASKITWLFGPPHRVRLVRGADLSGVRFGRKPADEQVVASLVPLLIRS